jgi:hypothetical protein
MKKNTTKTKECVPKYLVKLDSGESHPAKGGYYVLSPTQNTDYVK